MPASLHTALLSPGLVSSAITYDGEIGSAIAVNIPTAADIGGRDPHLGIVAEGTSAKPL